MHPSRPSGDRDVEPIVDHDSRRRSSYHVNASCHQICQRTTAQIALPDLNEVDRRPSSLFHQPDEALPSIALTDTSGQSAAIRNKANQGPSTKQWERMIHAS